MKKILTYILLLFSLVLYSQKPIEYSPNFKDTVRFNKPFITDNGDTCTIIKLNDSICVVINSDTIRIDGSGSISGIGEVTTEALKDSIDAVEARSQAYTDTKIGDTTGIYHSNRTALDLVSGTNTGDQDLSEVLYNSDTTTKIATPHQLDTTLQNAKDYADAIVVGDGLTQSQIESIEFEQFYTDSLFLDTLGSKVALGDTVVLIGTKQANGKLKVRYVKTGSASTYFLLKSDSTNGTGTYYSQDQIDYFLSNVTTTETDPIFLASSAPKDSARIYDSITALHNAINLADGLSQVEIEGISFSILTADEFEISDTTGMLADIAFAYFIKAGDGTATMRWGRFQAASSSPTTGAMTPSQTRDTIQQIDTVKVTMLQIGNFIIKEMNDDSLVCYNTISGFTQRIDSVTQGSVEEAPTDNTAPLFVSAEIGTYNDSIIVALFDTTDVHNDSLPSDESFLFTADDVEIDVVAVSINYDSLFLALAAPPTNGQACELDYTPAFPKLQDSTGNLVVAWVDSTVTNNISAAENSYFDGFNYTASADFAGSGGWSAFIGKMKIRSTGDRFTGDSIGSYSVYVKIDSTLDDDQVIGLDYEVLSSTSGTVGVVARWNNDDGGNGYVYFVKDDYSVFAKYVDGTPSAIAIGTANNNGVTSGDLRIECEGTTIRCYVDDELDESLEGGTGTFTDTSHESGAGGIITYKDLTYINGDNWTAKDL